MIISPKGRIETTEAKAKSLRSFVERLITYAKKDTVASRRQAYSVLGNRTLVKKLFTEVAPLMMDRNGGYTRVLKTGYRKGDSAPMAIIEFVGMEFKPEEAKQDETKKSKAPKKAAPKKAKPEGEKKVAVPKKPAAPKKAKMENIKAADLTK
jgi:large subunit ribosomal protein L17